MIRYMMRSFRTRARSQLAAGAVALAGATLLLMLATLLVTGLRADTSDQPVLILLPLILGGWSVAIVTFGIVSTVSLAVQQREQEIALLRAVGATPGAVSRMIVVETVVTTVAGVVLAIVPGTLLGGVVLGRLIEVGLVSDSARLSAGWSSYAIGASITVSASAIGAFLAGRRASHIPPTRALSTSTDAGNGASALSRYRVVGGATCLVIGGAMSVTTLFMPDGPLLSSTAGPAGVVVAVGLAVLSSAAARGVARAALLLPGPTARYASRRLRVTAVRQSTTIGPLVLLVGIAAGTLLMQSTEDAAHTANPGRYAAAVDLAPVNYLVVGIIIAFTCIAAGNSLVASTRNRRREFAVLRLNGATRRQTMSLALLEALACTIVATILGAIAAAATVIPFSIVRSGSPVPSAPPWMLPAIVGLALLVALLATAPTAARLIRGDSPEFAARAR